MKLLLRRPALLGKLPLGPSAGDDEPGAGRHALRRRRASGRWHLDRRRADPVDFRGKGEARPDRVHVRIGHARNDCSQAEIDDARLRIGEGANVFRATGGGDAIALDGERFVDRELRVGRENLAVDQDRLRALDGLLGRQGNDAKDERYHRNGAGLHERADLNGLIDVPSA